jgi:hypothetical protein
MPLSLECPSCRETVEVEDRFRGWTVRCPLCRHEFVAPAPPPEAPPPEAPQPDAGSPAFDLPTRHRVRHREPGWAAADVAAPATWLKVHGILGLVFGPLVVLLYAGIGALAANNPAQAVRAMGAQNEDDLWVQVVVYLTAGVLTTLAGVVILIGAGKMARLESHGWATAAAVLSFVPFANWCCCMGLPVGVWALVVLSRPDVRAAFDRPDPDRGESARQPDEWDRRAEQS